MIMKKVKQIIRKIFERPNLAIVPAGVLFVLSLFVYNHVIYFVSEDKVSTHLELLIVMSTVMGITITGILFLLLVSAAVLGLFKRLFAWIDKTFARKKGVDRYNIPGVNIGLLSKEENEE